MRSNLASLLLTVVGLCCGCPLEEARTPPPPPHAPTSNGAQQPAAEKTVAKPPADAPVYPVLCGCQVPGVGKCGNYARVGEETLPVVGLEALGSMPFCGKKGLHARIAGAVEGGVLHATGFELVKE